MFKLLRKHPHFFFSTKEKERILKAIEDLEEETSAELRVHLQRPRKDVEVLTQAKEVFEHLGMTQTQEQNGVLIFICPKTRQFAVLGDTAIHKKVPEGFWQQITRDLESRFQTGDFAEGTINAIHKIGEKLKTYFPRRPDDHNELSNNISSS